MASTTSSVTGYELNLGEYWQVILRSRWIIAFCAVSIGTFSALFTWINQPPALYSSTASVKIEKQLDISQIFLNARVGQSVDDMKTQLAVLESYALMERVAQRLGIIPEQLTSEEVRANPDYVDDVLDLKSSVSARQDKDTGIINITVVSVNAKYAQELAQAVADEFQSFNIKEKNKKVFEAKKFIEQQLVVARERLKASEERLRDYRLKNHLSAGKSEQVMARIVSDLEQEYRKAVAHLNDLKFALKQLRERVQRGTWDYKAVSVSGKVSDYFDQLNKRLVDMALKRTELSTNYTDEHPQIQELRQQAHDILSSMVDEMAKQVNLTQRRMQDIQAGMDDTQTRYQLLPEQALEVQRLQRALSTNEELFNLLEKKYQEVLIKEAEKVQEVSLVRPAILSTERINPVNPAGPGLAGVILGLVLGLVVGLVLEAMDTSVGTIEEVENFLEVPVVGFIPHLSTDEAVVLFSGGDGLETRGAALERQLRLVTHFSPPSTMAESYRSLRTNLLFSQAGENRVILITSSTMKEGKSTVAANLSVVVAQQGARVLLIDADLRKPMQHFTFGLERTPGLGEALLGQVAWHDAVSRFSDVMMGDMGIDQALMTTGLDQLDVMTCGRVNANAPDLLASPTMETILNEAREEYDMVIIDMPPLLHTTDATVIASKVDGVLLVYHIGSVVRGALKRVKGNIESVGGKVLGVVLNSVRGDLSPDFETYKMDGYYAYSDAGDKANRDENMFESWLSQGKKLVTTLLKRLTHREE